jgi:hypothetical protein
VEAIRDIHQKEGHAVQDGQMAALVWLLVAMVRIFGEVERSTR